MKKKALNLIKAAPLLALICFLGSCQPNEEMTSVSTGDFVLLGVGAVLALLALWSTKKIDWSAYDFKDHDFRDEDINNFGL